MEFLAFESVFEEGNGSIFDNVLQDGYFVIGPVRQIIIFILLTNHGKIMIVVAIDLTVLLDGAIEERLPGVLLDLVEFEEGSIEGDTLFGF